VGFAINDTGYVGLGQDKDFNLRKDFWGYLPSSNSWIARADFDSSARAWAVATAANNKGYVSFGFDSYGNFKNDFWEYNPSTDNWTIKAEFDSTARISGTAFSLNDKVYMGLGVDALSNVYGDFWEYDPAMDTWNDRTSIPANFRQVAIAFTLGNYVFVGMGDDGSNTLDDFWRYHPSTDSWTQMPDFKGGVRRLGAGFSIYPFGYIGLGRNGSKKKDLWRFVPPTVINTGPTTIRLCDAGDTITLGGNPTASNIFQSNYTYEWSPGQTLNDSTIPNPLATPTDTTTYTLVVTDSLGCKYYDTTTVLTPVTLKKNVESDQHNQCYDQSNGSGHVVINSGQPPYDYYWVGIDTTTNTSATTDTVRNAPTGTHTLKIIDGYGCTHFDSLTINAPPPLTVGTDSVPATTGNSDGKAWVTVSGGTTPYDYSWETSATTDTIHDVAAGTYTVTVTDDSGCTTIDSVTVIETSGIAEQGTLQQFNVYPSPASEQLTVTLKAKQNLGNSKLRIQNVNGETVWRKNINLQNEWSKTISLEEINAGIYFIQLTTDQQQYERKVAIY
jgi:hypothetical protein